MSTLRDVLEAGTTYDGLPPTLSQRYTRAQYRDAVLHFCIERNQGYDELPACAFESVGLESLGPTSAPSTNRLQPNRLTQHQYFELFMRTALGRLQLYPYRHVHSIVACTRETPLSYYTVMLGSMLYKEQRYDQLPNFTAIDILNLLGVGRNQYLELLKVVRVAKLTASCLETGKEKGLTGVVGGLGKVGRMLMGHRAATTDKQDTSVATPSNRVGRVSPLYGLPTVVANAICAMQQQYLPSELLETHLLKPFYVVRAVPGMNPDELKKLLTDPPLRRLYEFLVHFEECVSSTLTETSLPQDHPEEGAPLETQLAQLADQRPAITFTALYEAFVAEVRVNRRQVPETGDSTTTRSSSSRDLFTKADESSDSTPVNSDRLINPRPIPREGGRLVNLVRERLAQQRWIFDHLLSHSCPYSPSGSAILHGDENQIAPVGPYFYASELPFREVNTLHQRGLVFSSFAVNRSERIHVPPLERFVMNRTTSDPQEALLYKVLSTTDRNTSMSMLAELLRLPIDHLCSAAMLYERLGLAERIGTSVGGGGSELASDRSTEDTSQQEGPAAPCDVVQGKTYLETLLLSLGEGVGGVPLGFLPLVATPTADDIAVLAGLVPPLTALIAPFRFPVSIPHESWDQLGGRNVRTAGQRLQALKHRHVLTRVLRGPQSPTLSSTQLGLATSDAPKRRIALLYDSAVAGVLMMTNLSADPTFKQHAVTLFEAGKLSFDMLHVFEQKLSQVEIPPEMLRAGVDASSMFDAVFSLRDVLGVLRRVSLSRDDDVDAPTGVDMLKVESVNELPADTRYSILCRNYTAFFILTPLSTAIPLLDVAIENIYGPTVSTQTASPWCALYLHSQLYCRTDLPLAPMWLAPAGLRVRRLPADFAVGGIRGTTLRPSAELFPLRGVSNVPKGSLLTLFSRHGLRLPIAERGGIWDAVCMNSPRAVVSETTVLRCSTLTVEAPKNGSWESRNQSDCNDVFADDHSSALLLDPATCLPAISELLTRGATLFSRVVGVPQIQAVEAECLPPDSTEEEAMLRMWVPTCGPAEGRFTFPTDHTPPKNEQLDFSDLFLHRKPARGQLGACLCRSEPFWVGTFEVQVPVHAMGGTIGSATDTVALYVGLHLAERRAAVCKRTASSQPTTFGSAGRRQAASPNPGTLDRMYQDSPVLRASAQKSTFEGTAERRLSLAPSLRSEEQSLLRTLEERTLLLGAEQQVGKLLDSMSLCAASCRHAASLVQASIAALGLQHSLGSVTVRFGVLSSVISSITVEPFPSSDTCFHCELLSPSVVDVTLGLITNDRRVCRHQLLEFAECVAKAPPTDHMFGASSMAAHSKAMHQLSRGLDSFTGTLLQNAPSSPSTSSFAGIVTREQHTERPLYFLSSGVLSSGDSSKFRDGECQPDAGVVEPDLRGSKLPLLSCDTMQRNVMHLRVQLGDPLLGLPQPATEVFLFPQ